jgi:hypothetical protein
MKSWLAPNILGKVKADYKALRMKVDKRILTSDGNNNAWTFPRADVIGNNLVKKLLAPAGLRVI